MLKQKLTANDAVSNLLPFLQVGSQFWHYRFLRPESSSYLGNPTEHQGTWSTERTVQRTMHTFILCVLQSERLSKRSSQVDLWHTRPVQKKCTRSTGSIWFKSRSRVKDICLWELSIPQRDGAGLLRLYMTSWRVLSLFQFQFGVARIWQELRRSIRVTAPTDVRKPARTRETAQGVRVSLSFASGDDTL